jgi:uncharacterized protein Usg
MNSAIGTKAGLLDFSFYHIPKWQLMSTEYTKCTQKYEIAPKYTSIYRFEAFQNKATFRFLTVNKHEAASPPPPPKKSRV